MSNNIVWGHSMFFFLVFFFLLKFTSSAPSATTPPPTFKWCIRNIKTSPNNVLWCCLGSWYVFFFNFFFSTDFASSAPSPMMLPPSPDPHLRTTYQEHQSKLKQHPPTLFGLMVCFQGMLFLTDITFQLTACIFGLHDTFLTPSFIFLLRKFIYHI